MASKKCEFKLWQRFIKKNSYLCTSGARKWVQKCNYVELKSLFVRIAVLWNGFLLGKQSTKNQKFLLDNFPLRDHWRTYLFNLPRNMNYTVLQFDSSNIQVKFIFIQTKDTGHMSFDLLWKSSTFRVEFEMKPKVLLFQLPTRLDRLQLTSSLEDGLQWHVSETGPPALEHQFTRVHKPPNMSGARWWVPA